MAYEYTVASSAIASGILLLTLAPKSSSDRFAFASGQYAGLSFRRGGRPTPVRCFSIVSSPYEPRLQFAMRVHGRFTRTAARLTPGETVYVDGPFGEFTVNEDDTQLVLLAGGIGITPFISMLRFASETRMPLNITLLFSNRHMADAPFVEELAALADKNPRLRVYFFATGAGETMPARPSTRFVSGAIGQEHLQRLTTGAFAGSTYFVCGPKGFMKSMQRGLQRLGVDETRIVSESFTQTSKSAGFGRWNISSMTYGLTSAALIAMTGFIMFLDLSRNVAGAAKTAASSTGAGASSQSTTSAQTTTTPTTNTTNTQTQTVPQTTYYQPPTSAVS